MSRWRCCFQLFLVFRFKSSGHKFGFLFCEWWIYVGLYFDSMQMEKYLSFVFFFFFFRSFLLLFFCMRAMASSEGICLFRFQKIYLAIEIDWLRQSDSQDHRMEEMGTFIRCSHHFGWHILNPRFHIGSNKRFLIFYFNIIWVLLIWDSWKSDGRS